MFHRSLSPSHLALVTLALVSLMAAEARAQAPKVLEVSSDNRAYTVVVTPQEGAGCEATLSKGKKKIWTQKLVNEVAPEQVFVTNSGDFVVTVDEWRKAGTNPLVIYNKKGAKVAAPSLGALGLTDEDLAKVKKSQTATWWARDAYIFFGPKSEHVIMYLRSGKFLVTNLKSGKAVPANKAGKLVAYGRDVVGAQVVTDLGAENAQQRRVAAEIAGQLKIKEASDNLRALLEDSANFRSGGKRVYYVRKAAVEALQAMGEEVGAEVIVEE
jgi:hypothetical protein